MISKTVSSVLFVLFMCGAALPAAQKSTAIYDSASRVIAFGDIHGKVDKAIRLLKGSELVDKDLNWIGGEQQLVVCGDITDRGSDDRAMMDLFRRLQGEAEAAGGRVHVLLGNHEVMNLMRDLRYVNVKSYGDFVDEEKPADRKNGLRAYMNGQAGSDSKSSLRTNFEKEYPPGYFGRQRAFDPDGEYGEWLLSLPAIVRVNDVLFVHGGLTMEVATLGVDGINERMRKDLEQHLEFREALINLGVFSPLMDYAEMRWVARQGEEQGPNLPQQVSVPLKGWLTTAKGLMMGPTGPLWYRGNSFEDERIERDMLQRSLELLDANTMVVADGVRIIETNGLPDHETGEFPNAANPNSISPQRSSFEFPGAR